MKCYILTTEAQEDLRKIREYLLIESGGRAVRYVTSASVVASVSYSESVKITP